MIVEPDFVDGPKLVALEERLGRKHGPHAVKFVLRLWAHCHAGKRGECWGPVGAAYVERVAQWAGPRGELFEALTQPLVPGRFPIIELRANGTAAPDIVIHDWADHNGNLIQRWNANPNGRRGKRAATGAEPVDSSAGSLPTNRSEDEVASNRTGQDRTGQDSPSSPTVPASPGPSVAPPAPEGGGTPGYVPEDAEVLAFGAAFPGEPASGAPGPMDPAFVGRWLRDMLGRQRFPPLWKRQLVAAWREEFRASGAKKGGPGLVSGTGGQPEWAADRDRRELLKKTRERVAEHPCNRGGTGWLEHDRTPEMEAEFKALKRQLRELETGQAGEPAND